MNWKQYEKMERDTSKKVSKRFAILKKYLIEELKEAECDILMGLSLYFQKQVPVEERRVAIVKKDGGKGE